MRKKRPGVTAAIALFVISLFLIVIGAILTVSIVFFFIGLPLLIIGALLAISSIFLFIHTVLGGFVSLFRLPKKRKQRVLRANKSLKRVKKGKIIDVDEKEGIYRVK